MTVLACMFFMGVPTMGNAQVAEAQEQVSREIPSPENNAKRISREVKKHFGLDESQYNKVYKLYLKQEKDMASSSNGAGPGGMPGGRMGGGPGGMGGPGGGMGGPGGGMGGPGGGMGGPGGGMMPGGMGGDMPSGSASQKAVSPEKMMEQMRKQQEQRFQKLAKKMKKILTADQYAGWEEWEKKRNEPKGPRPGGPRPEGAPQN